MKYRTRKNRPVNLFYDNHYYSSKYNADRAKAYIIANSAMLNYNLGQALNKYLKRLKRISRINWGCLEPKIRPEIDIYYQNANELSKIASEDLQKLR